MWGEGEDREVVGAAQTEEGLLHLCFDGVWEGSVRVGETNVEQLVVEGTGRGEGETTVKSVEGEVRGGNPTSKYAWEMEPREMVKRQEKELLRADCRESRCLGCRRITKLVRAWTATVECQRR